MMAWFVWVLLQQAPSSAMLVGGGWMDLQGRGPTLEALLRDRGYTGPSEVRGMDLWVGGYAGQVYLALRFAHPRVDLRTVDHHARVEYPAWWLEVGELYPLADFLQTAVVGMVGAGQVRWTLGQGGSDIPLDTLLRRYTLNRAQAFRGLVGLGVQILVWMPTGGASFAGIYARAAYVWDVLRRPMVLADGVAVVDMPDVRYRGPQISVGVVFRGTDLSATAPPPGGGLP